MKGKLGVGFDTFQFTPLREGRRDENAFSPPDFISIHAPPRGATNASSMCHGVPMKFQFTPLREGRPTPFRAVFATF